MGMAGGGKKGMLTDINVTPLVDVMLVLLIIFMVTAPMMTQGVDITLPETTAKALPQKEDPIVITIDKNQGIHLDKTKMDRPLLRQELTKLAGQDKNKIIYLRADRDVAYGLVAGVMTDVKDSGFEKLGMVTQPPSKP